MNNARSILTASILLVGMLVVSAPTATADPEDNAWYHHVIMSGSTSGVLTISAGGEPIIENDKATVSFENELIHTKECGYNSVLVDTIGVQGTVEGAGHNWQGLWVYLGLSFAGPYDVSSDVPLEFNSEFEDIPVSLGLSGTAVLPVDALDDPELIDAVGVEMLEYLAELNVFELELEYSGNGLADGSTEWSNHTCEGGDGPPALSLLCRDELKRLHDTIGC